MPTITINKVGELGIIKDIIPHQLPPEAWSDASNFHMVDGAAVKAAGHQAVYDPPTVSPYGLMFVQLPANLYWLYPGLAKVYVVDAEGGTHTDLTRATGGDYSADADIGWNGGVLGNIPILNNGSDEPQMWNPVNVTQRLQALTNWPASTTCKCMRVFKQFLIAMDVTESGTRYPYIIRVSDVADPGAVPGSWDYTDPSNLSIRRPLQEGEDFIVDGLPLRDTFVIYKEHSVWGMTFIGGQSIWRTFPMFRNFGLMARDCFAQLPQGRHLVATDSYDLRVHNGQVDESILTDKMQKWLEGQMDPQYFQRSYMVKNEIDHEVYFCFVTTGNTLPNKALVWNWRTNTLGIQDLDDFAFGKYGFVTSGGAATIDELTMNIDDMDFPIDSGLESRFTRRLLWAKPNVSPKLFYGHTTSQREGTNFRAFVERTGLAIIGRDQKGRPVVDLKRRKFLSAIYARIEAAAGTVVEIYTGEQATPLGSITWKGPYNFTVGTDEKVDVMASAKLLGVRFETSGSEQWSLHGYDLDIELDGDF